jgi:hypothetical protein
MLISEQNPEQCDATADASSTIAGKQIKKPGIVLPGFLDY